MGFRVGLRDDNNYNNGNDIFANEIFFIGERDWDSNTKSRTNHHSQIFTNLKIITRNHFTLTYTLFFSFPNNQ